MPRSQTIHLTKPDLCILSSIKNVSTIWQKRYKVRCHSVSLETCHVLLFLFHDHSEPTTVVYFSLGRDSFFISLGSHMGYSCCYIQAKFCKQFPVIFSVFSRDLNTANQNEKYFLHLQVTFTQFYRTVIVNQRTQILLFLYSLKWD